MSTDKQTKLLYLLNQIDELKDEKKTALKDFNATIEELNRQVKDARTALEDETHFKDQLEVSRANQS